MALTKTEFLLMRGCAIIGATKEETTGIVLALRKQSQQDMMLDWMANNMRTATVNDLIGKTMDILRTKNS